MSKKWQSFATTERGSYDDRKATFVRFSPPISNKKLVISDLLELIGAEDERGLAKFLRAPFAYKSLNWHFESTYRGSHHLKTWQKKYFLVSSVVEMLFFEEQAGLRKVVSALKSKRTTLQESFIKACKTSKEIPEALFLPILHAEQTTIEKELSVLEQNGPSHPVALELASSLQALLNEKPTESATKLEQLEFKLRFIETLHAKDKELAAQPNYKKIIVNLSMMILGFLPNLINFALSGNFIFFKETSNQASVSKVDRLVNVREPETKEPEEPIDPTLRHYYSESSIPVPPFIHMGH